MLWCRKRPTPPGKHSLPGLLQVVWVTRFSWADWWRQLKLCFAKDHRWVVLSCSVFSANPLWERHNYYPLDHFLGFRPKTIQIKSSNYLHNPLLNHPNQQRNTQQTSAKQGTEAFLASLPETAPPAEDAATLPPEPATVEEGLLVAAKAKARRANVFFFFPPPFCFGAVFNIGCLI